jgi:hypothetical protein
MSIGPLLGLDYTFAGGAGMLIADGPVPNPLPPPPYFSLARACWVWGSWLPEKTGLISSHT